MMLLATKFMNGKCWGMSAPSSSFELPSSCLTECVYQSVVEGRIPHTIVKLLFTLIDENIKVTVL